VSGSRDGIARQIANASDLQVVVRSMKTLAAANILRYERAVTALQGYDDTVQRGLSASLRQLGLQDRPPGRAAGGQRRCGVVIIGSDQGLVGRFNDTLLDAGGPVLSSASGVVTRIWTIGERMSGAVHDRGLDSAAFPVPATVPGIAPLVGAVLAAIAHAQAQDGLSAVTLLFHAPAPAPGQGAPYAPCLQPLLPLDDAWLHTLAARPWPRPVSPDLLSAAMPSLQALISDYLFVRIFRACVESMASENASRLTAMQRAERNIETMLEGLHLLFQRRRQEAIDEELFDVISGSEALHPRP